ncbi:TOPRIM nucleotidyl transferase/hydrolase domain-containing protein [Archangium lansingense]|uniref:OLD protein-like TOPRIM domain-containing protein n=1 Tax=Archangium lansingense TaxID=2995310 RepID=A0ABT4A8C3_9BACT|nr:TOPRIM nucleotidyl transferase/hydrolase domain-containing protein [Archangium lansinium]MCY1077913.1 hypothetical protein [Archangium lansinium]
MVRRDPSEQEAHITSATLEQVASVLSTKTSRNIKTKNNALVKLEQALQPSLNEMFFSEVVVLVEGPEDVACITACLELLGIYDDFIRLGGHFVAVGGKSRMVEPLAVAKSLKIPTFVVFDADGDETKQGHREKHEKDNRDILCLCNSSVEPFPADTLWAPDHVMWSTKIQDVVEAEIGREAWMKIKEEVRQEHSLNIKDVDKHSLFIAYCLTHAWGKGARFSSLERLCNAICAFASAKTGRHGPPARPVHHASSSGLASGAA